MLASEKYDTFMCRDCLETGPNFNRYENIANLPEDSAWAETHYSQSTVVYNAFIIPHPPLIKGRNVKAVRGICIYQVLLVTSPVLRLLTPGAFLQL